MWSYIKRYLHIAVLAALCMMGEVLMDLIQPGLMSRIVDDGVLGLNNGGAVDLELICRMGLWMIGLVLFGGLCGSLNNAFVHLSVQNIGNEIRKDCFQKMMTFSFPQMDGFGTGSLVTRVTNDITQIQNYLSSFLRGLIRTSMLTFGSMYFMFRLNLKFGLAIVCAFPFVIGCMVFCMIKAEPRFSRLQIQLDAMNSILQEDVSGIRMIKACVREGYEKLRFGKANDALVETQFGVLIIFAFMNPVVNALMYLVVTFLLVLGSVEVEKGSASPGTIMAAITYTTQLLKGIIMLVMLFQNLSRGYASWKRVKEILRSEPGLKDGSYTRDAGQPDGRHGEIEFRDVSFAYPGSSQTVLKHINLKIREGETVAVMGATGCGKTTLVNLIPRFYEVSSGAVLVDGVDVREYSQKALREKIAVTLQKSELFSTTVEQNILWGRQEADAAEVKKAAKTAQADEFIVNMDGQYDTLVAERGMSLSGGQKQRISIARAVLKSADILILDDSTSALDLKTEAAFYDALQKSHPRSTKIIVAQRIASVRRADRIIVLDHGQIAAAGSHEELLKTCPVYQDICDSQTGEEEAKYV